MPQATTQKTWDYIWVGYGESPAQIPPYTVYIEEQSTGETHWYWSDQNGNKVDFTGPRPNRPPL